MQPGAIKLAVIGMDHRSQLLFKKTTEHQLQDLCEIVDVQDAEACIVDMDSPNSKEYWDSLKENFPQMPVMVLSIKPISEKNTIYLRKPIKIPSLISTLKLLFPKKFLQSVESKQQPSQRISSPHTAAKPSDQIASSLNKISDTSSNVALRVDSARSVKNLGTFDPKIHLAYFVKKAQTEAITLNKTVRLTLHTDQIIIIRSQPNEVITNLSEGMLRSLSFVNIDGKETTITSEYIGPEALEKYNPRKNTAFKRYNAECFLWLIGVFTARGRIPLALDGHTFSVDKTIYIQHWPNLTRLEPIPHVQQIVALLIQHPRSIGEISAVLEIDAKHVASLLFAGFMIGYSGQAKRPSDKLFESEQPEQHKNRKILSAIMSKLRGITGN